MANHATTAERRGMKRKRLSGTKSAAERETQAEVIAKKLHHGIHEARKAAKKAAAFELRKLVKRLKAARQAKDKSKDDDPSGMERQLEILKTAEHEQFANTALKTKILKDHLLSQNEDVQAALAEKLSSNMVGSQEPGSSAAKVHGRLLSSKILAEAVHAVLDSLREVLDPSRAKDSVKVTHESEDEHEDVTDGLRPRKKTRVEHDMSDDEGVEAGTSDSEAQADDAGWESGTVDEEGEGDAGWESGSINDAEPRAAVSSEEDDVDDEPSKETPDTSRSRIKAANPTAAPLEKNAKAQSKAASGESTFLPSLSVGFTRGDSDASSDLSDGEADAADTLRKNRRGQRARRAIWEKKYGRNANHVKVQRERESTSQIRRQQGGGTGSGGNSRLRGFGRDGSKKFTPPLHRDSGYGAPSGSAQQRPGGVASGRNVGAVSGPRAGGKGARGSDKPLHPSWEAKRKLKEKLHPGIVPSQGKKITF